MPSMYLSPSTQQYNIYYDSSGSEEYYMNLIADAMMPYLRASGITVKRNTPDMTAGSSIAESNRGEFDIHLALHSNAAPEHLSGRLRGSDVYYEPGNRWSQTLAEIIAANLKTIYHIPDLVNARPTDFLGEVLRTRAPAVLIEYAYHDSPDDAEWIKNNINEIARVTSRSVTEYFGLPFIEPQPVRVGIVTTTSGNLNLRNRPSLNAQVIGSIPSRAEVYILGVWNNWYVVQFNNQLGFASADFIRVT